MRPPWRRALKWVGIAALAWIVLSFLAFALSSQIQKWKLSDMGNTLHGNPFLAVSPQTILVLGTDIRSGQFAGPDEAASKSCLKAAGSGKAPPSHCTPYRSDTIMLIRAGGGAFRKLSIPRDTLANIPGHPENKINSAYALGGAKLTIRTVAQLPRHQHRPGGDHRLRRLSQVHRHDRWRHGGPAHQGLLDRLGRGLQPEAVKGRAHAERLPGDHSRTHPREHLRLRPVHRHRHRANRVPAADPGRDQGPAHQTRCACPTTSSRARSSAGTRRRRWSRAWARGRCRSSCSRRRSAGVAAPTS